MATNNIKFNVKNGLSVGASGFEVINPAGEWVGASGPGQSPYGATGSQGYAGVDGASGIQGLDGASGAQGLTGDQGNFGLDGEQGVVGEQGTQALDGAIKLQHTYEWTDDQLQWRGNAYAGGVSPSVSRLEFLSTDAVYGYLASISPGTKLVIDWNGLSVATVTTIGTVQSPTAYTNGRHYLQISANPDGYAAGGYASTDSTDVLMIGDGPRNQGYRGGLGDDGVQGSTGASGIDGASGVDGYQGVQGASGADGDLGASGIDGASGPTGEIGVQGASGSDGDLGASGIDGASGPTGQDGATGIDGASGTTGDSGIDGASGVTGQDGATGPSGSRYHTTSTTNLNLTTGATGVVVVDDHLQYSAGQTILLADGGGKHIHASVISYNENTKVLAFTPIDHVGTGSSNSWEINLDGAEGAAGASGVTGQAGATGATGIDGYQGVVGATGTTGDFGEQGYQGASGADGYQGATGSQGTQGDQYRYYASGSSVSTSLAPGFYNGFSNGLLVDPGFQTGDKVKIIDQTSGSSLVYYGEIFDVQYASGFGFNHRVTIESISGTPIGGTSSNWLIQASATQGASGADGNQGVIGSTGTTGDLGEQGYQGETGLDGVQGATGTIGDQGETGDTGYQGVQGASGAKGIVGERGETGVIGEDGLQGASGATGFTGATGAQGGDGSSTVVQFDTSYGHYGAHQTISSGSNGTNTILSGTVGYIESAITTAEMATYANSGLSMFGVRLDADIPATTNRIGLGTSGIDVNNALGMYDDQSQGFQQDGTVWIYGTQTDALSISWGVGDLVEVAVNYNTGYFWARVNGGAWSKSGDPVAGTNGSPFLLAQPHSYPAVSTLDGAIFELITTPQYDVPSGYTYLGNGAPTNTGYQGATGADGLQGDVGNAGYDADQLTYGTPRGAWDIGTYYYVDDIVVTIAPSPDSHRCIVPNIGNDPDTTSGYWVTTAYAGASGASGITGEVGIDGASGVTGETGTDGASGVTGIDGATGITGTDGASGVTGQDGATGIDGLSGIDGASGPTGDTGTDGATGYNGLQFKATANGNFSVYAIGTPITIPFLADPDTGFNSYNYSVGQSVVIAQDANNYMVADITNVYGSPSGSTIDVVVTASYGTASGVSGWIVNLDGAVGQIGASGATGIFGASGATGIRGTTGGNGAAYDSINATVSSFPGYTGLDNAYLVYPSLMGSYLRVQGPLSGITAGMTVTYGGNTYTVYDYIESGDEYSQLRFTNYPVTGGAIPPGASIVIEGYGAATNTGYQGASGLQGTTGQQGLTGDQGNTGQQGLNGDSGIQGPDGDQGTTGASGAQGIYGATGHIGATGYGLGLGATSFTGTSQQTIELFAANQYGTTKYLIQGIDVDGNVQATQVILTHNATGVYMTEYATLLMGPGGAWDYSGNLMSLSGTIDLVTESGSVDLNV